MSLTERMRNWIIKRDNHQSQLRHYTEQGGFKPKNVELCEGCDGTGCGLQVHHIDPRRNGGGDVPDNLITVLQCEHNGRKKKGKLADPKKEFVIHPDMVEVFQEYRKGDKQAFNKMGKKRQEKLDQGETYWNTDHDAEMLQTAKERTDNVTVLGWIWPRHQKRKK